MLEERRRVITALDVLDAISEKEIRVCSSSDYRVTQTDIAKRIGCSSSTISRLLPLYPELRKYIRCRRERRKTSLVVGDPTRNTRVSRSVLRRIATQRLVPEET